MSREGGMEKRRGWGDAGIMHAKRCAVHRAQIHIIIVQVVASLGPRLGPLVLL